MPTILGPNSNDTLNYSTRADNLKINGLGGNDMLYAGTGHDIFRFAPNDSGWTENKGGDTIIGFKGLGSGGQGDIIEFLNYGPDAHLECIGSSAKVVGQQYYAVYARPGTGEVNRVDVIAIKLDAAAAAGRTLAEGDHVFHS